MEIFDWSILNDDGNFILELLGKLKVTDLKRFKFS